MITFDSREVNRGDTFVALRGAGVDGHDFIGDAIERGAARIVCERVPSEIAEWRKSRSILAEPVARPAGREGAEGKSPEQLCEATAREVRPKHPGEDNLRRKLCHEADSEEGIEFIVVSDSHRALGELAAEYYGHPSQKLKLVGITGTNGKTTTATLLCDLAQKLGHRAGLISTVEYRVGDSVLPSTHTTPDPVRLNRMMAEMVDAGCEYCFMEVSSHSVVQQRIAGLEFAGGVFTNITHDHLDYHGTFAEYIAAKKRFFDGLPVGSFALVNVDDRNGRVMVQNTGARVRTFSLRAMADYRCRIVEQHADGTLLQMDGVELWTEFVGRFNAYNLLSVYGVARELGFDRAEVLRVISALKPVSGRFETMRSDGGVVGIVDYAHTPDALENVLGAIAEIRGAGSRVYTVVGCGGERDRAKRPVMARIAAAGSDMAFLTSDNPRSEDPAAILEEMRAGLGPADRAVCVPDRREAIRAAVAMARAGDIVLVAGKGHETYQIVGTERHHFDDREEIKKAFIEYEKMKI